MKISRTVKASSQIKASYTSIEEMLAAFEDRIDELDANSSEKVMCGSKFDYTSALKNVPIGSSDYHRFYKDVDGGFGEAGATYSLEEIKKYWNQEHDNDYSLAEYDSFEDWWNDTKGWLEEVDEDDVVPEFPVSSSDESKSSKAVTILVTDGHDTYVDVDGVLGSAGTEWSMMDLKQLWNDNCESDPIMSEYSSFGKWWADTKKHLDYIEE